MPEQAAQASTEPTATKATTEPARSGELWEQIDATWSKRINKYGKAIPGPIAAADGARALGVPKLSSSGYKTLQGLLNASEFLAGKWSREGNTIISR